ncbi:MAG: host-nuclease inhibitor Gam family protein [Deltaproteobacteria bacterium]|nr:host-nuclease inhibitor Gam family protein [Deltaproteobacteria bacterium]
MSEARDRADELLAEIGWMQGRLSHAQAEAEAEMEQVKAKWQDLTEYYHVKLTALEKELKALVRKNKAAIFGERDRVDLAHGSLIWAVSERVKRAKTVTVEVLEALGEIGRAAVRVVKSVDWDALESWPEERLVEIGTERVRKKTISYELKERVDD